MSSLSESVFGSPSSSSPPSLSSSLFGRSSSPNESTSKRSNSLFSSQASIAIEESRAKRLKAHKLALNPITPSITHDNAEDAIQSVQSHGLALLKGALDPKAVSALLSKSKQIERKVLDKLKEKGIPYLLSHSSDADQADVEKSSHLHSLPSYSLNVFIPLHDVTESLGPTSFLPGTHSGPLSVSANSNPTLASLSTGTISPLPSPGDVLVYDYRTIHRGTANTTGTGGRGGRTRHMMYLMYSRP
ncbi:hypothetical protein TrRE_jg47, partial [Triparma retinervis]